MFGAKQEKIKDTPIFPSDIGTEKPHFKDGTLFHTGYTDDGKRIGFSWAQNKIGKRKAISNPTTQLANPAQCGRIGARRSIRILGLAKKQGRRLVVQDKASNPSIHSLNQQS